MTAPNFIPDPISRRIRIFSFDPGLASQYDMAGIGEITIKVPWEELQRGPIGEYIEVIDVDHASGVLYRPVDLSDPKLLAQDGLAPSESNPQFHQQMVYAVAMTTIGHFERALGRVALWSAHRKRYPDGGYDEYFVRRLRIYPHALRDRNAYYSPEKKALLFGYFPVEIKDEFNAPGTMIFTCLSHDIIAHETTHALLDGVHPRFNEPVNVDVLAFHEAFADIVALFQHFAYPGVLRDQISRTRGNLANENMLAQLAQQFGRAAGRGGALRDALGRKNEKTGKWEPLPPDANALERISEPHDRGAVLVAAVFGAFSKVYRARTLDLFRIATEGTGVLREGDIHPDLAKRLAEEAARIASYILQMCIRAIDYCPPVDITFGDYLRGIITADYDLNPDDEFGYRLAFVESFRQWGIHPRGMRSMSIESLMWPTGEEAMQDEDVPIDPAELKSLFEELQETDAPDSPGKRRKARSPKDHLKPWHLDSDRFKTWQGIDENARVLWAWLVKGKGERFAKAAGIILDNRDGPVPATVFRPVEASEGPAQVEVHSVRTALRRTAKGATANVLVVEITQRRRGYFDPQKQKEMDSRRSIPKDEEGDFRYRAGCTLLIDPASMTVRRVIRTAGTIADNNELERQRRFLVDGGLEPNNAYSPAVSVLRSKEPFAILHRHGG
ncbi:hypothetical protein V1286_007110 [Bradyrhizobium algeriense]|uniref:Peptidase M4 n=1 Tax=Bradyrhizobium algeriense TaxID=634784 RepID=A0ABU8BN95_9BRAD